MLFNSLEFLFWFLPATFAVAVVLSVRKYNNIYLMSLVLASLVFYGWGRPEFIILLVGSVLFNYLIGRQLMRRQVKPLLWIGVAANLLFLCYFKYAGFFLVTVNWATGSSFSFGAIALPLAISFFTFQQIAYLVDVYRGIVRSTNLIHYSLFVTFFPQLIAGPIVHHSELIPQLENKDRDQRRRENLVIGLSIFSIGVYKKVIFADGMSAVADMVFGQAAMAPTFLEAWAGTLAYTFQIYFDFSGYSDMAMGLARMFGILLPINFFSPYKSLNIVEFWRRWHITLSRFLRDYLYIPLGGSRFGSFGRYRNLMIVMLLGGLWHGAGWNFVLWGGLHGIYLVINHAWQYLLGEMGFENTATTLVGRWFSRALMFLAIAVSWTLFRAESLDDAVSIYRGMAGLNGIVIPVGEWANGRLLNSTMQLIGAEPGNLAMIDTSVYGWLLVLLAIVWIAPNTYQLFHKYGPALDYSDATNKFSPSFSEGNRAPSFNQYMATLVQRSGLIILAPLVVFSSFTSLLVIAVRGSDMPPFIYMYF